MAIHPIWYGRDLCVRLPIAASLLLAQALPAADATNPASTERGATVATATAPAAFKTQVRFINHSPFRRVEWGLATVPFPQGVWTQGKTFRTPGYDSELTPFGLRWPDGSWRFAQLAVALDLAPGEERIVDVVDGWQQPVPFVPSFWVQRGLPSYDFKLVVGVPGVGRRTVWPSFVALKHDGYAHKILQFRGRVPDTDLVCDLWLNVFSGADHMPFELRLTQSNTGSVVWEQDVDFVDLWVSGAFAHIRGADRRGTVSGGITTNGPNQIRLLGAETLFDGQGHEWWGELLFVHPLSPAQARPQRISTVLATMTHPLFGPSAPTGGNPARSVRSASCLRIRPGCRTAAARRLAPRVTGSRPGCCSSARRGTTCRWAW